MKEYQIEHKRHGCYYVNIVDESKDIGRYQYLTCFRNKKAAKNFVEEHKKGNVTIDPETCIPTPDFR
tara:strand:- start:2480 stop:2680 length:201 start_codon:yes stop_codon:yes gene_type:complete